MRTLLPFYAGDESMMMIWSYANELYSQFESENGPECKNNVVF